MASPDADDDVVHEIYPGGDTLLLCGPSGVKLLVHSIFLTNASKVFAAMFGSNFREGQMPTNGGPREIPLPEDDPFAMQLIFNALHLRSEQLPDTMSPKELPAIAYAADKYDHVTTLKYAASCWISLAVPTSPSLFSVNDLWVITIAAYMLRDAEGFHSTTAALVLGFNGSFRSADMPLGDFMSSDILLMLEEKRNRVRLDIIQELCTPAIRYKHDCFCGWDAKYTHAWMMKIVGEDLFPKNIAETTLSETIYRIESLDSTEAVHDSAPCDMSQWHRQHEWLLGLYKKINELKCSAGISLDSLEERRYRTAPNTANRLSGCQILSSKHGLYLA